MRQKYWGVYHSTCPRVGATLVFSAKNPLVFNTLTTAEQNLEVENIEETSKKRYMIEWQT